MRGDQVGDSNQAKPNEGLRLADRTGWVAVGGTISGQQQVREKVIFVMNSVIILMAGNGEADRQRRHNSLDCYFWGLRQQRGIFYSSGSSIKIKESISYEDKSF